MYKRETQSWVKHLDFIILDIISLFLALLIAYAIYNGSWNIFARVIYRTLVILAIVLDVALLALFNTMHNVVRRGYAVEAGQTVKHAVVLYSFLSLLMFALKSSAGYSRMIVFLSALLYVSISYVSRIVLKRFLCVRGPQLEKRKMILVCAEEDINDVLRRTTELDEAQYAGVVIIGRDAAGETIEGLPVVANMDTAADYICREWVDEVFFYVQNMGDLEIEKKRDPDVESFINDSFDVRKIVDAEGTVEASEIESPVARLIDACRLMAIPFHIRVPLRGLGDRTFIEKVNGFHVITCSANYASTLVLEPEQVEEQSSPLPKEFLQRAEEGLEKNLQSCHKNAKTRLENMTPRVYTTLRRRKEDLPWLLSMRN